MQRSNTFDSAQRAGLGLTRGVWLAGDDARRWQEGDVNMMWGERRTRIERIQNYGFSSVPLPPTGSGRNRRHAEAIIGSLGGNRSHQMILAVDDRRYRPTGLQPGESVQYDDQNQRIHLSRAGIRITTPRTVITESDDTITIKSKKKVVIEADDDVTVTSKKKVTVKAKDEIAFNVDDKRWVRIRQNRMDLMVKDANEEAVPQVSTTAGPSAVIFARID